MFCNNCGKQLNDNARFCLYCGKSQQIEPSISPAVSFPADQAPTPINPAGGRYSEPPVSKKTDRKKKKSSNTLLFVLILLILLLTIVIAVAGTKLLALLSSDHSTPISAADQIKNTEDDYLALFLPSDEPLLQLSMDRILFYEGDTGKVTFTVTIPDEMFHEEEPLTLTDDQGKIVYSTQAVSSGCYEIPFEIDTSVPEVYLYTAHLGAYDSQSLVCQVVGIITEEMYLAACGVGEELKDYIESEDLITKNENGYAEYDASALMDAALEWLLNDPRVLAAEINNSTAILYVTTDHVGCIYSLPAAEGYLGSNPGSNEAEEDDMDELLELIGNSSPYMFPSTTDSTKFSGSTYLENLYKVYDVKGTLADALDVTDGNIIYLDTLNTQSSRTFSIIASGFGSRDEGYVDTRWYDYTNDLYIQEKKIEEIGNMYSNLGYHTETYFGAHALNGILNSLCHSGIATVTCHGSVIKRSNNSYMSCYQLYKTLDNASTMKNLQGTLDHLAEVDESVQFYSAFYCNTKSNTNNTINADYCMFLADSNSYVYYTSNMIRRAAQVSYFDNTLLFFGNCFGTADVSMCQYLITRGCKAVLGFPYSVQVNLSDQYIEHFLSPMSDGSTSIGQIWESNEGIGLNLLRTVSFMGVDLQNLSAKIMQEGSPYLTEKDYINTVYINCDRSNFAFKKKGTMTCQVTSLLTTIRYDETGSLISQDMELVPCDGLQLTFKQFENQGFNGAEYKETTDDNGEFTIESMDWGAYGIYYEGEKVINDYSSIIFSSDVYAGSLTVTSWKAEWHQSVMLLDGEELKPASSALVTFTLLKPELECDESLVDSQYQTSTKADGSFDLKELPGGIYQIDISYLGNNETQEAEIQNGCIYYHGDPIVIEAAGEVVFSYDENNGLIMHALNAEGKIITSIPTSDEDHFVNITLSSDYSFRPDPYAYGICTRVEVYELGHGLILVEDVYGIVPAGSSGARLSAQYSLYKISAISGFQLLSTAKYYFEQPPYNASKWYINGESCSETEFYEKAFSDLEITFSDNTLRIGRGGSHDSYLSHPSFNHPDLRILDLNGTEDITLPPTYEELVAIYGTT